MATIATHNGSAVSQGHNRRDPKVTARDGHIDPNGHYEVWRDEPIRDAYHRLFDKAVDDYNSRQTRDDRRIDDYFTKIDNDSKKHVCYEMIVGVYGSTLSKEDDRAILEEYVKGWDERNPNLELVGAYYHADEQGQPHVHLDYIPIVRDCERGLEVRTALNAGLRQQGIEGHGRSSTPQMEWQRQENQCLDRLCRSRGLEIDHPQSKGHAKERAAHLHTEVYKVNQIEKHLQQERDRLEGERSDLAEGVAEHNRLVNMFNRLEDERSDLLDYAFRVEQFCAQHGLTEHDYAVHEWHADRGERDHLYPEVYNPERSMEERELIGKELAPDRAERGDPDR